MHTNSFRAWVVQSDDTFFTKDATNVGNLLVEDRITQKLSQAQLFSNWNAAEDARVTSIAFQISEETKQGFTVSDVLCTLSLSTPEDPGQLSDNQLIVYAAQDQEQIDGVFLARGPAADQPNLTADLAAARLFQNPPRKDGLKAVPLTMSISKGNG